MKFSKSFVLILLLFVSFQVYGIGSMFVVLDLDDSKTNTFAQSILKTEPQKTFTEKGCTTRVFITEVSEDVIVKYKRKFPEKSPLRFYIDDNLKMKIFSNEEILMEKEVSQGRGYAVLLEETIPVVDYVPFWGSIPLIGKLFQTKGESRRLSLKWICPIPDFDVKFDIQENTARILLDFSKIDYKKICEWNLNNMRNTYFAFYLSNGKLRWDNMGKFVLTTFAEVRLEKHLMDLPKNKILYNERFSKEFFHDLKSCLGKQKLDIKDIEKITGTIFLHDVFIIDNAKKPLAGFCHVKFSIPKDKLEALLKTLKN